MTKKQNVAVLDCRQRKKSLFYSFFVIIIIALI